MVGLEQFLRRAVKKKKNKRTKIIIQPTKYYGWLRGKGRSGSSSVSDWWGNQEDVILQYKDKDEDKDKDKYKDKDNDKDKYI